jgi:hypothetical protein
MNKRAEKYTRLGIMAFYHEFCLGPDTPNESTDHELRIRDFLTILLYGIESKEVVVYGGDIKNISDYIKIVDDAQRYEWAWDAGAEQPEYRKVGYTNPRLLWLKMFGLETEMTVDPEKLLSWMEEKEDRKELLVEVQGEAEAPHPGSTRDNARIMATRQACDIVRAEIDQEKHGFQVSGKYKTNHASFAAAVQSSLGSVKAHRDTVREEWEKVSVTLKHSGRVPEQ